MPRMTITLDAELQSQLRRYIPARGLNRSIVDAINEKVSALERHEIEAQMRERYISEDRNHSDLIADWSVLDVEGWPE